MTSFLKEWLYGLPKAKESENNTALNESVNWDQVRFKKSDLERLMFAEDYIRKLKKNGQGLVDEIKLYKSYIDRIKKYVDYIKERPVRIDEHLLDEIKALKDDNRALSNKLNRKGVLRSQESRKRYITKWKVLKRIIKFHGLDLDEEIELERIRIETYCEPIN
ncbi:MAG: hypothetical protein COA36_16815 [Desulfotalea sp.]|nr:MAG: hypothetical protein COA36_16815 [Desulfotalea sp.]